MLAGCLAEQGLAGLAGWVGPGWPGPILLSGNYPGTIRELSGIWDGLAGLGLACLLAGLGPKGWACWAGLGVLAGWAWTERLGLLGWLGVLAGRWLDFDEKGTNN